MKFLDAKPALLAVVIAGLILLIGGDAKAHITYGAAALLLHGVAGAATIFESCLV